MLAFRKSRTKNYKRLRGERTPRFFRPCRFIQIVTRHSCLENPLRNWMPFSKVGDQSRSEAIEPPTTQVGRFKPNVGVQLMVGVKLASLKVGGTEN
jgi:hypothetical protein